MPCMEFCADMPRPDSFGPQSPPEEWGCDSPCHDIVDPLMNCFDQECFNQPPPTIDWTQTCAQTDGCLFSYQSYSCVPDTPTNRCRAIQDQDACGRTAGCTFNYDVSVSTRRTLRKLLGVVDPSAVYQSYMLCRRCCRLHARVWQWYVCELHEDASIVGRRVQHEESMPGRSKARVWKEAALRRRLVEIRERVSTYRHGRQRTQPRDATRKP